MSKDGEVTATTASKLHLTTRRGLGRLGSGVAARHARSLAARFADPDPGVRWAAREAVLELRAPEAAAAALEDHRAEVTEAFDTFDGGRV